ncbi:unnamed protein product [Leptosia nina]|uniref:Ribosomal protein S14 n=1 Tax=Leptosia nina TaxID=320188 RepID=A0AAV1JG11_9NEOP
MDVNTILFTPSDSIKRRVCDSDKQRGSAIYRKKLKWELGKRLINEKRFYMIKLRVDNREPSEVVARRVSAMRRGEAALHERNTVFVDARGLRPMRLGASPARARRSRWCCASAARAKHKTPLSSNDARARFRIAYSYG